MPISTALLLILCGFLFVAGLLLGGKRGAARAPKLARFSIVLQLGAVALAYFTLRPGEGDDGSAVLSAAAAKNEPLFLDFYSNY